MTTALPVDWTARAHKYLPTDGGGGSPPIYWSVEVRHTTLRPVWSGVHFESQGLRSKAAPAGWDA
jgi:hypothetical protein